MKIAMLTNNYKPFLGGVPISIDRLVTALRQRGHEVTILAPEYDEYEPEQGVVRYAVNKRKLQNGMVIPDMLDSKFHHHFENNKYDVIHVHHPMLAGYMALYMGHKHRTPVVFTYHTRYEQYLHYVLPFAEAGGESADSRRAALTRFAGRVVTVHNRIFTNRCDLVFAPTPMMRDFLYENGTYKNVAVLPTGLGEEDFGWDEGRVSELRAKYAPGGERLFICVARLEKEKNLSFLLGALKRYKELSGGFKLLMIGDGSEREALIGEAAELGLEDNIIFTGNIAHKELCNYYRAADIFLFTSKSETQGIVLLEGMAAGNPVVAVEASGVCDVVENGVNGWMVKEDMAQFAHKLSELTGDDWLLGKMSEGAEKTALRYTDDKMAEKAEKHYESVIYNRLGAKEGLVRRVIRQRLLP